VPEIRDWAFYVDQKDDSTRILITRIDPFQRQVELNQDLELEIHFNFYFNGVNVRAYSSITM
jgi:hypothetical protein